MQAINQAALLGLYGVSDQAAWNGQTQKASDRFQTALKNAIEKQTGDQQESMDAIFEEAAATYGISVNLLKAVAKAESNFNPSAVSKAGAMGVMQLMPGTASSLGVTDPFDARQNIMGGAKYLKMNLDRYGGDVSLALAAYNAGPNSVAKYGGIPPYQETQNYVKKVCSYMEGEPLYAGTMVDTGSSMNSYASMLPTFGGNYGSSGLGNLYGMSALGGYGSSALGSLFGNSGAGSLYGTSDLAGLGSLYGSSDAAGLGSLFGSSAQTGMGSLYGLSSIYGSSTDMLSLLFGAALDGSQDDDDENKKNLYNAVELMRLQAMMNASSQVGSITI